MLTILNSVVEPLPGAEGNAPEWVHLLPAGTFSGVDGRGPFELGDAQALIDASMTPGRKLPIDINHSTDIVAKDGRPSPAVGWIVSLDARGDGIWGKVEWNTTGRKHVAEKDYGYLSPVFTTPAKGPKRVSQLLRAALTNDPNLTLTSLHHRTHEDREMEEELRKALGLPAAATSDQIAQAVKDRVAGEKAAKEQMSRIAAAIGLAADASETAIVTELNSRRASAAGTDANENQRLRDEVKELNTKLTEVVTNAARGNAETVVNRAIEETRLVPALKDRFISRHMKDPKGVEEELALMPQLNSGGLGRRRPAEGGGDALLSDEDSAVAELMGLDPKKFAEQGKITNRGA